MKYEELPTGVPLLLGNLENNNTQIAVTCPLCKMRHFHAINNTMLSGEISEQTPKCSKKYRTGPIFKSQYFVGIASLLPNVQNIKTSLGWWTFIYNPYTGKYDSDIEPAMQWKNGDFIWYKNGLLHRIDGPALKIKHGSFERNVEEWRINGKLHRENGPAAIRINGQRRWYLNDQLHREDGPAIENPKGNNEYYLKGIRHREDGPAIIRLNGKNKYFWYGELCTITEDWPHRQLDAWKLEGLK